MDRHDTTAAAPDALESNLLARRLRELAGEERDIQVDFLVHLEVFDRRRAFLEAGYDSLWTYCLQVLHLREGPAWRRIGAMRILRRFPALEAPLRDGRLCLSTVTILGPVLTPDNFEDLVGRAAYRTKAEVDQIVASIQPRIAPRDGVRKLTQRTGMVASENATIAPGQLSATGSLEAASLPIASPGQKEALGVEEPASPEPALERASGSFPNAPTQFELRSPAPRPAEVRAVSADTFSLRVTIDADLKKDLDTLTALLSHKTSNDLQEVLREAVRCAIGEHGKRKGLVKPRPRRPRVGCAGARRNETRGRNGAEPRPAEPIDASNDAPCDSSAESVTRGANPGSSPIASNSGMPRPKPVTSRSTTHQPRARTDGPVPRAANPRAIPAEVRRRVWERDEGCCAWTSPEGVRCRSRWMLEIDHIRPVALGGESTIENLRLTCRSHNVLAAEQVFGRDYMERCARNQRILG